MHIDTDYIKERKEQSGVTWKFISEQTGIKQTALSRKMHGSLPWSLSDVWAMSQYLDCSIDRLVRE